MRSEQPHFYIVPNPESGLIEDRIRQHWPGYLSPKISDNFPQVHSRLVRTPGTAGAITKGIQDLTRRV